MPANTYQQNMGATQKSQFFYFIFIGNLHLKKYGYLLKAGLARYK